MLTPAAIFIATSTPMAFAALLWLVLRKSTRWWQAIVALAIGVLLTFPLNTFFLRLIPSMVAEDAIIATTSAEVWASAILEAAIPEELAKGIGILALLLLTRPASGAVAALVGGQVGIGFALAENLSYAQVVPEWRMMAVFGHAAWGIILGALLRRALAQLSWRAVWIVMAFVPTIVLHGLLDAGIFLVDAYEATHGGDLLADESEISHFVLLMMLMTFVVELIGIVWAVRIMWRVRREAKAMAAPTDSSESLHSPTA